MAHDRPHHLHGMAMGAAGYGIFTLYDTLLKQTSHAYPQWQIMATTSATSAVLVMAFALMTGGIKRLKTSRPALHFARATFSVISFGCAFYAIRHIPLTDFYGIIFAAPIISTALSILWLREHVNWQRWLAVIGGFAGIIVMLKTGIAQAPTDTARLGYFASMAAAVLNSAVMIMVRRYGQGETNVAFSFYSALYCFLLTSALLLAWGGVAYATADLALVILAGALGGGASVLMMSAFLRAPRRRRGAVPVYPDDLGHDPGLSGFPRHTANQYAHGRDDRHRQRHRHAVARSADRLCDETRRRSCRKNAMKNLRDHHPTVRGMVYAALGYFGYTVYDTCIRTTREGHYPPWQALCVIAASGLVTLAAISLARGGMQHVVTKRPGFHLGRGLVNIVSVCCSLYSVTHIQLAEFYTIIFLMPPFVALLTAFWLREPVKPSVWFAIAAGLCGALLVVAPWEKGGFAHVNFDYLVPFGSVVFSGTAMVMVRRYGQGERPLSIPFWFSALNTVLSGTLWLLLGGKPFLPGHIEMLLLVGVVSALSLLAVITAFQIASPAHVTPFQYTQFLWGALLGYWIFGDVPPPRIWVGAALVIGAGAFLLHRQARKERLKRNALPPEPH
ncbi:MAG: DMT family transporter [Alphaproteobacteria bacterium]